MTKKDFELIAKVIKRNYNNNQQAEQARTVCRDIVTDFSLELLRDNPRFDSNRFIEACGF